VNKIYEWYYDKIYLPIYRFVRWNIWEYIQPSNFKHWYQRARYGYSYQDCWGIDWHLANIIPKMIRDMKKNIHGHPGNITMDEWYDILDTIAKAFELEYELKDSTLFECVDEEHENHMKELMKDKNYFKGCRIMTQEEKDIRDRGWKYFREYFGNLWD
jgi:hypothetical protein